MVEPVEPKERSNLWPEIGCFGAIFAGIGFGLVVAALLAKAWNDCGVAAPAFNELGAAFDGAVTAALTGAAFLLVATRLKGRSHKWIVATSVGVAALVAVILFVLMLPASFSGAFFPNNGVGICPGNVPPWLP
jgi:hypothetical protein